MYRVCECVYYCREMYTDVYKLMQTDVYWYILCRLDSIAAGYSADVALLYPDILMILMACRVSIWRTVSILNILELLKELFFKTYIIYNTYIYIYIYVFQGTVQLSSCLVFQIRSSVWRTLWLTLLNSWREGSLWENRAFFQ